MRGCKNCGMPVQIPDGRTGLIHSNGQYVCARRNKLDPHRVAE